MKMRIGFFVVLYFISLLSLHAEVSISTIIGDHMVIQRDETFTIRGHATKEKTVKVIFSGQTRNAICKNGKWEVIFPAQAVGGPYTITIYGDNTIFLRDIYFGDVFLCSGQSNMEWRLDLSNNPEQEIADTDYPLIRMFTVEKDLSPIKKELLHTGAWEVSTRETARKFSAIGYLFGRALHKRYGVPIGLIMNAWGGSEIDPYMDEICFADKEAYLADIRKFQSLGVDKSMADSITQKWTKDLDSKDVGLQNNWQQPFSDRSTWTKTSLPGKWEQSIWPAYDGVGWYAKTFEIAQLPDGDATIHLGQIDDTDFTYINGTLVGSMEHAHDKTRAYTINKSLLREGKNEIVIRMVDYTGGGGLSGKSEDIRLDYDDQSIPLSGSWLAKKGTEGHDKPDDMLDQNSYPTSKYNPMVHPLIYTKLKGILWYQGESDWNATADYEWKSIRMINDYRIKWNQPRLPFLFVQLANWTPEAESPRQANWGEIRNSQHKSLHLMQTAMVTAIDLGDAEDIHPRNKQDVADRLVQAARALVYDEKVPYQSPTMSNVRIAEDGYVVAFDYAGHGLSSPLEDKAVSGFAIYKEDKLQYVPAYIISKNKVLIPSADPRATLIRYLWADHPGKVTLYNDIGLPALPFQFFVEK